MNSIADEYIYVPARQFLEALWPHDLLAIPDLSTLDGLWIQPVRAVMDHGEGDGILLKSGLFFETTLELGLPGFDVMTISIGDPISGVDVPVTARVGTERFSLTIGPVPVTINLRADLFVPAEEVSADPRVFEARPGQPLSITVGEIELTWAADGSIEFSSTPSLTLPYAMLADTGIVVSAEDVRLVLSPAAAAALPLEPAHTAPGLYLDSASIYFPGELAGIIPDDVHVAAAYISHGGLSAIISGDWSPKWDAVTGSFTDNNGAGTLFDLPFAVERVQVQLEQNLPVECAIEGQVIIPYFEEPAAVAVQLGLDGDFALALRSIEEEGFVVRKEEVLALTMKELDIRKDADVGTLIVSGSLKPLLMASDGLVWPQLDVVGLEIDTTGRILIRSAWLDLDDIVCFDLFGFMFELTRIGLGYEEDTDDLWIDLTGSIHLIEQIPVGLGVEGFRITWPRALYEDLGLDAGKDLAIDDILEIASRIEVRFAGIQIFYGVPQAVEFEGLIRFFKEAQVVGFAGDMALRLPATGFVLEAGLMLGINFEEPPYPFLFLSIGVELPAGIPLGQSGLALKGALGILGLNVEPARDAPQNWYFDWYKGPPKPGAHQTTKWRPARNAVAVGLGVTITTVDGYVKGVRGLIVLALPGPILILEGRSLILEGLLPAEPPFRALAVFDGSARTVQFNLEAEGVLIEDVLEAYAPMEAFFDFADLTNWHLYLGQDQPAERRVRASLLRFGSAPLFRADTYLMLDMIGAGTVRARMGVLIGFEPPIRSFGPVAVQFRGAIEGGAEVTLLPEQFQGDVLLSADIGLQAFGWSCRIAVDADILAEGPDPFSVEADLHLEVELPQPLEALDQIPLLGDVFPEVELLPPLEIDLHFEWQSPPSLNPESPLSDVVISSAVSQHQLKLAATTKPISSATAVAAARHSPSEMRKAAEAAPVAALDAAPILAFAHNMNDATGAHFARHPDGHIFDHQLGRLRLEPDLRSIRIYRHRRSDGWTNDFTRDWALVASTVAADGSSGPDRMDLYGVWHADVDVSDPVNAAVRRLRLWSTDPFSHTRGALGPGYGGIAHPVGATVVSQFLDDRPDYYVSETDPVATCVSPPAMFGVGDHPNGHRRKDGGITVQLRGPSVVDATLTCLRSPKGVDLHFEVPLRGLTIEICNGGIWDLSGGSISASRPSGGRRVDVPLTVFRGGDRVEVDAATDFDDMKISGAISVKRICWITDEEHRRAVRAGSQTEINTYVAGAGATEPPILVSDCDYRIEVVASSSAELIPAGGPLAGALDALYKAALKAMTGDDSGGTSHFLHEAYFCTQGPPTDLSPYIASTYPATDEKDVLRGDDLAIRFRRPNVHAMFDSDIHRLKLRLLGPDGRQVPGYETVWAKARSATLHYDERLWLNYQNLNPDDPNGPLPDDDLLVLRRTALFQDRFSSHGVSGWSLLPSLGVLRSPRVSPKGNELRVIRSRIVRKHHRSVPETLIVAVSAAVTLPDAGGAGKMSWADIAVSAVVTLPESGVAGLACRVGSDGRHYAVSVNATHVSIVRVASWNVSRELARVPHGRQLTGKHDLTVITDGPSLSVELDGHLISVVKDNNPLAAGHIGLIVSDAGAAYSHVRVTTHPRDLLPRTRYELVLTGGVGGRMLTDDATTSAAYRNISASLEVRPSIEPVGISLLEGAVRVLATSTSLVVIDATDTPFIAPIEMTLDHSEFYPLRTDLIGENLVVIFNGQQLATVDTSAVPTSSGAVNVVASRSDSWRNYALRDAALFRIPFTTSRFATFRDLFITREAVRTHFDVSEITVQTPLEIDLLDKATFDLECGVTSLRDELIDREHLEMLRQVAREASASRDELIRKIALSMKADIFSAIPNGGTIDQAFAGAAATSPLLAVCIRSIESLQIRHKLTRRTTPRLYARPNAAAAWQEVPTRWVWSSDGTVLIALPLSDPHRDATAQVMITLRYERDLGDEDKIMDHRFDRPVRRRGGEADAEEVSIMWRRHADD